MSLCNKNIISMKWGVWFFDQKKNFFWLKTESLTLKSMCRGYLLQSLSAAISPKETYHLKDLVGRCLKKTTPNSSWRNIYKWKYSLNLSGLKHTGRCHSTIIHLPASFQNVVFHRYQKREYSWSTFGHLQTFLVLSCQLGCWENKWQLCPEDKMQGLHNQHY